MNSVSSNQSVVSSQQGLFDAIKDLLFVNPIFLFGIIVICVMVIIIFKKNRQYPKLEYRFYYWYFITTYV